MGAEGLRAYGHRLRQWRPQRAPPVDDELVSAPVDALAVAELLDVDGPLELFAPPSPVVDADADAVDAVDTVVATELMIVVVVGPFVEEGKPDEARAADAGNRPPVPLVAPEPGGGRASYPPMGVSVAIASATSNPGPRWRAARFATRTSLSAGGSSLGFAA
jgi:hypothetical protein